ncbi:MAG TPA: hypothetical protein VGN37_00595 [Actinocatenispora sp.]
MSFRDVSDPTDRLTKPEAPSDEEFQDPWDLWTKISSNLSVSHWVWEASEEIFDFNPVKKAGEWIAGDWTSFAKQASLFHNIGAACRDIGGNVHAGRKDLEITWWGNAADGAFSYLDRLSADIAKEHQPLDQIAKIYTTTAHGVWTFTESLEDAFNSLGDQLLVMLLSSYAGSALSETGVGAIVGYGVAALEVAEVLEQWEGISHGAALVTQMVNAAIGDLEDLTASGVNGVRVDLLPDTPYRNPLVGARTGPVPGERS